MCDIMSMDKMATTLQLKVISVTCPLVPCNPPASRCEALRAGGRRVCEIFGLKISTFSYTDTEKRGDALWLNGNQKKSLYTRK